MSLHEVSVPKPDAYLRQRRDAGALKKPGSSSGAPDRHAEEAGPLPAGLTEARERHGGSQDQAKASRASGLIKRAGAPLAPCRGPVWSGMMEGSHGASCIDGGAGSTWF
jgi:hypothetical protein